MPKKKLKHEDYIEKILKKKWTTTVLEEYKGSNIPILHRCECGVEFITRPDFFLDTKSGRCKKCNHPLKTHENYLKDLYKKNIKIFPLEQYNGSTNKIKHKCECGNEEWVVSPNVVLSGSKCWECHPNRRVTKQEYIQQLKENDIKVQLIGEYILKSKAALHKCTCGNEWYVLPNDVLKGTRCNNCSGKRAALLTSSNKDEFIRKSNLIHYNRYDYKKVIYESSKIKVEIICNVCNNIFLQSPNVHLLGHGCPNCSRNNIFKDKRMYIYYIKLNNYFKIGITKYKGDIETSVKYRYRDIKLKDNINIEIIDFIEFQNGEEAYKIEQNILNKFKNQHVSYSEINIPGGYTEVFKFDILMGDKLKKYKKDMNE